MSCPYSHRFDKELTHFQRHRLCDHARLLISRVVPGMIALIRWLRSCNMAYFEEVRWCGDGFEDTAECSLANVQIRIPILHEELVVSAHATQAAAAFLEQPLCPSSALPLSGTPKTVTPCDDTSWPLCWLHCTLLSSSVMSLRSRSHATF